MPHPILLYDGMCGLCNRFVQFVLRHDPGGVFRFASLQSPMAERIVQQHVGNSAGLATVYVVVDYELPGERLLSRLDAVIFVLKQLAAAAELRLPGQAAACPEPAEGAAVPARPTPRPKRWRLAAKALELVPATLRDWGYGVVARNRYRIFGRYDSCLLPAPENRERFLDG